MLRCACVLAVLGCTAAYTTHSKTSLLQQTQGQQTQGQQAKAQQQAQQSSFDANTCAGLSGKEQDTEWCKASCGMIVNPTCPESFCKCEGELPTGTDAGLSAQQEQANRRVAERDAEIAARDEEVNGAAQKVADTIAERDAEIEGRIGAASSERDDQIAARDADINSRKPAGTMPAASPGASPGPAATAAVPVDAAAAAAAEAAAAATAAAAEAAAAASPAPNIDWATGAELPTAPTAPTAQPYPAPAVPAGDCPRSAPSGRW